MLNVYNTNKKKNLYAQKKIDVMKLRYIQVHTKYPYAKRTV